MEKPEIVQLQEYIIYISVMGLDAICLRLDHQLIFITFALIYTHRMTLTQVSYDENDQFSTEEKCNTTLSLSVAHLQNFDMSRK